MVCLSGVQLEAYIAGALPADAQADAAAHVASCDLCTRSLATLKSSDATVDGVVQALVFQAASMPTQIGPYQVLEKLGEGGMGSVFTAYHPELDRKVAIKVLLPQIASAESGTLAHARLIREAQAMAQLDNPHVVAIHDVGSFQNQVYLVMDRVNGVTMGQWLKAAPRSWREIIAVMVQAGRGLEAAHKAGLVHRDFKPANVLVGVDGRVRVADFGIARRSTSDVAPAAAPVDPSSETSQSGVALTGVGLVVGTPSYMAPEQFEGVAADARSDQFSFCVSLYEALYEKKPFAPSLGVINRFSEKPVPPPARKEPSFVRAAILRGLSISPSDRFESMGALLAELSRQPLTWRAMAPWVALAATFVVMSAAVVWATRPAAVPGCSALERGVGAAWGPDARQALQAGFADTHVTEAVAASAAVVSALDAYAQTWSQQQAQACTAAVGAPIDSPAYSELRCLELQRMQYQALIEVLTHVTPEMLAQGASAVASLMPPKRCADPHAIASLPRTPSEQVLREKVQALRLRIANGQAFNLAGLPKRSLEVLMPLVAQSVELNYLPLQAEVELAVGDTYGQLGDSENAAEHFHEAARAAEITGQDALAAHAVGSAAFFVSYLGKQEKARMLLEHAEILSERSGRDAFIEGLLENSKSLLDAFDGNLSRSLEHQKRAVELRSEVFGPKHPRTLQYKSNLAQSYIDTCRPEEAIALLAVFNAPGQMHTSPSVYLKGLALLAASQIAANQVDGAAATLALAQSLITPADMSTKCLWYLMHSQLALKNGQAKVALESAVTALEAGEAVGHDSVYSVFGKVAVGAALTASGRPVEAVKLLEEALPLHQKLMGDDQVKGVYAVMTEAYLAAKRPQEALMAATQWLDHQARSCASAEERAVAQWALSRALQGTKRDLPQAQQLAREARSTLASMTLHSADVSAIDEFLSRSP